MVVTPEAEDGAPAPPVRVPVTVESIETHFAPVEATTASVAEAVLDGALPARTPAIRAAPASAGSAPARPSSEGADEPVPGEGKAMAGAPRPGRAPELARPRPPTAAAGDAGEAKGREAVTRSEGPPAQPAVMPLPPATVGQLGDAIVGAVREMTPPAAPTPAADGEPSARAVVKVLNVRLDPPEYGSVAVRLTLQGGSLSVQIRAERETTAAALDRDREKLAEHLKASGYGTDAAMIDTRRDMAVMRSDGAANANGNAGNGGGSSGAPGQAPAGGQSFGDGAMARREGNRGQGLAREQGEGRDGAVASDPGAGGLYV
jgi:hypothetical protein